MGKIPTDEELKNRAQSIQKELRKTAEAYEDPVLEEARRLETVQKRVEKLKAARAAEPTYRKIVQESQQHIENALSSVERYNAELKKIAAQIGTLRDQRTAFRWDS